MNLLGYLMISSPLVHYVEMMFSHPTAPTRDHLESRLPTTIEWMYV